MSQEKSTRRGKKRSFLFQGGAAIGIVVGLCAGIILALGWEYTTGLKLFSSGERLIAVFATLIALLTAYIAFLALSEQSLLRQAGTDPVLIAHFGQRSDTPVMIMLCLSNVGAGAALDVEFKIATDKLGFDQQVFSLEPNVWTKMRSILQGETISIHFGRGFVLLNDPRPKPFKIGIRYSTIDGTKIEDSFILDPHEIVGLSAFDPPNVRTAKALEDLAKSSNKSFHKLDRTLAEITELNSSFRAYARIHSNEDKD